jgi:PadR family transcriptional regulator PadR
MALLSGPARHWGYELSKRSGVRSGVLYPMLSRMLDEGWVQDGWEDPTTKRDKHPPRRYYELTYKGREALIGVVQQARRDSRFADLFPAHGPVPLAAPGLDSHETSPKGRFA